MTAYGKKVSFVIPSLRLHLTLSAYATAWLNSPGDELHL